MIAMTNILLKVSVIAMMTTVLYAIYIWRLTMRIKPVNPIAKAIAHNRRRQQVVPPKKGKGSYNRKHDKEQTNAENKTNT